MASLLVASALLGGCDALSRAVGKDKVIPDEFAVVSRAPLAIPPDYALRPPRVGALRPQEETPVQQARQTVFRAGEDAKANLPPAADQRSVGEGELLREAGAGSAQPDIRQLVESEASNRGEMNDGFIDKLAFWRADQTLGPTDSVIDPSQEAERLKGRKDQADAKASAPSPLAATPTIERTKSNGSGVSSSSSSGGGWFSWLF
jgi:hypothetical protein